MDKEELFQTLKESFAEAVKDSELAGNLKLLLEIEPAEFVAWVNFLCRVLESGIPLHQAQRAMQMGIGMAGTIDHAIRDQVKIMVKAGIEDVIRDATSSENIH